MSTAPPSGLAGACGFADLAGPKISHRRLPRREAFDRAWPSLRSPCPDASGSSRPMPAIECTLTGRRAAGGQASHRIPVDDGKLETACCGTSPGQVDRRLGRGRLQAQAREGRQISPIPISPCRLWTQDASRPALHRSPRGRPDIRVRAEPGGRRGLQDALAGSAPIGDRLGLIEDETLRAGPQPVRQNRRAGIAPAGFAIAIAPAA